MKYNRWFFSLLMLGMALLPACAEAAGTDSLIEGAKLCTRHLPRYEREYAIPTHLLSAIASTESGRYHEGLKIKLPWPWAINVSGKSFFFDSKDEAIGAVRKWRARGIQNIDVGCMQVNLRQHPEAFATLDEAFEPETNIAYAASFLRSLYENEGSWKMAAADYHSKTPRLGKEYVAQVYDSWYQIIDKLRAARLHVPESSVQAMNEMKTASLRTTSPHVIHIASDQPTHKSKTQAQEPEKKVAYVHPHMNSVQVSNRMEPDPAYMGGRVHDDSIIVVHNDNTPDLMHEIQTAANNPSPLQTPIPESSAEQPAMADSGAAPADVKVPAITEPLPSLSPSSGGPHKSGPNFIFND